MTVERVLKPLEPLSENHLAFSESTPTNLPVEELRMFLNLYDVVQKARKSVDNLTARNVTKTTAVAEGLKAAARKLLETFGLGPLKVGEDLEKEIEKGVAAKIRPLVKQFPLWNEDLSKVHGLGELRAARIIVVFYSTKRHFEHGLSGVIKFFRLAAPPELRRMKPVIVDCTCHKKGWHAVLPFNMKLARSLSGDLMTHFLVSKHPKNKFRSTVERFKARLTEEVISGKREWGHIDTLGVRMHIHKAALLATKRELVKKVVYPALLRHGLITVGPK